MWNTGGVYLLQIRYAKIYIIISKEIKEWDTLMKFSQK